MPIFSQEDLDGMAALSPAPKNEPPSDAPSGDMGDVAAYMAKNPAAPSLPSTIAKEGASPDSAIEESPLSLMERGMLGWVRTPQEQEKYLRQHFDDVQLVGGQEGGTFAVKRDNKWFQANPNFEWKFNMAGAGAGASAGAFGAGIPGAVIGGLAGGVGIPSLASNITKLPGKFAQMTGEYGLRSAAAIEAGAPAFAAATAAASPLGPLAPVVGLAAGAGAAALGAGAAEGADLAARQTLPDGQPGKTPYKNPDEITKELMASAMFGAQEFVAGKALKFGANYVADTFSKVVKSFQDTPEGHQAVRRLLGALGAKPEEIQARLIDPAKNATFDKMAAQDALNAKPVGMGILDKAQEGTSVRLEQGVQSLLKKQQSEFATMAADPDIQKAQINFQAPFQNARASLQEGELIMPNGKANELRVLGDTDKKAIDVIMNRQPMVTGLGYREARAQIQDINSLLNQGVSNGHIKSILNNMKTEMNEGLSTQLEGVKSGAGVKYGEIMNKYADVKALQESLDTATSGNKRFTLANKMISDSPNQTKQTMDSLVKAGIDPNLLVEFVQQQGSRNADSWFTNKNWIGKYIPTPGPKVGSAAITGVSQAKSALSQAANGVKDTSQYQAALPYLNKTVQMMRGMPTGQLKNILTNPQALDTITSMVGGAATKEQTDKMDLLKQSGVVK